MNSIRNLIALACVVVTTGLSSFARADFTFGEPVNLGPIINSAAFDNAAVLSQDGLCLYFQSGSAVFLATRDTKYDPWGNAVNLGAPTVVDDFRTIFKPLPILPGWTTGDGLEIYIGWNYDIWMMKRPAVGADWSPPVNLGAPVNSSADEIWATISSDGLELYFSGYRSGAAYVRPGGYGNADLWVTKRATRNDPWGAPENLGPVVNSANQDARPYLSPDDLALFFDSHRPGGYGSADLYVTRRATRSSPWGPPMNLGPVINSSLFDEGVIVSPDGAALYWDCARPGGYGSNDIWQTPVTAVIDFNGDGKVDGKEVLAMAQHWGENYPLCDIAPFAWGDSVVDLNDLTVLAGYIGQEVNDPTLSAHWALDETEGTTAADSAGENDGTVAGGAAWQPQGKIGGALAFDGVDDVVTTRPVQGLGKGPFSLMAWVQGGAPGQVVLGHSGGSRWLYLDPTDGSSATEVVNATRGAVRLVSKAVIADGQWHRIAVVWDGTHRMLYVDEEEVARDTQTGLTISDGGLLIGAGTRAGSHWSGLIDDVRVYNRAVQP